MKIAQVAPLAEAVPPKLYGGTERVVAYLTDALVELGHDVTLFASGDSSTKAVLSPVWPRALRLDPDIKDHFAPIVHAARDGGEAGSRVRCHPLPHRLLRLSVASPARVRPRSRPCTAASICPSCLRSTGCTAISPWCRFPIHSACRCRKRTSSRRCCTGCPRIC